MRCDDKKNMLGAHQILNARDELPERVVELQVNALHFRLPVCHVAGWFGSRECDAKHIAHLIVSHRATADGLYGHLCYDVVRKLLVVIEIRVYISVTLQPF